MNKFPNSDTVLLHVYQSGANEHIVGNKTALKQLKASAEKALKFGIRGSQYYVTDGEGYSLVVMLFKGQDANEFTVYPQSYQHDYVFILGKKSALENLVQLCDHAMCNSHDSIAYDRAWWETRQLAVICLEDYAKWEKMAVPYSDESAADRREDAIYPKELVKSQEKS